MGGDGVLVGFGVGVGDGKVRQCAKERTAAQRDASETMGEDGLARGDFGLEKAKS